jgi:outer membrane PBP1 activator LpoA protein
MTGTSVIQKPPVNWLYFGILLSGFVLMSGCSTTNIGENPKVESREVATTNPQPRTTEATSRDQSDGQSTPYSEQHIHLERAKHYDQLASKFTAQNEQHQAILSAAENYIHANDYFHANQAISPIQRNELGPSSRYRYDVIRAYLYYAAQHYQLALNQIDELLETARMEEAARRAEKQDQSLESSLLDEPILYKVNKTQYVDALLLSSFCQQKLLNFEAAIASLIERERLLTGKARAETIRYTWQVIHALSTEQKSTILNSTHNPLLRNRLTQSMQGQFGESSQTPTAFNNWREGRNKTQSHAIASAWDINSPKHIAVLLPFTSKYSKAAEAVMDGIKFEHSNNTSTFRPRVDFYDIGNNPLSIQNYYNNAIDTGADFIIGPIAKDYANQITPANQYERNTPTILLGGDHHLDRHSNRYLFRLAPSPEADARALAQYAFDAGHISAGVLTPNTNYGNRSIAAFRQAWLELGGNISNVVTYSEQQYDHSTQLKSLFNINDSEYRHRQLSKEIGFKPKFSAYRRSDIDFIVMLANNQTGRILRPQINFYSGKTIPVYSSSMVFNGIQNPIENLDLEHTIFPVTPWVLQSTNFAQYAGQLNVLFAMGADAYSLSAQYRQFRDQPSMILAGKMGRLSVRDSGDIRVEPIWAQFKEGVAEPFQPLTPIKEQPINKIKQPNYSPEGANYNDANWDARSARRKLSE